MCILESFRTVDCRLKWEDWPCWSFRHLAFASAFGFLHCLRACGFRHCLRAFGFRHCFRAFGNCLSHRHCLRAFRVLHSARCVGLHNCFGSMFMIVLAVYVFPVQLCAVRLNGTQKERRWSFHGGYGGGPFSSTNSTVIETTTLFA